MKKLLPLWSLQILLAIAAGTLIAQMSFLAKSAIAIFQHHYRYYAFLKIWWQTATLFMLVWLLLLALQYAWYRRLSASRSRLRQLICIALAAIGLYASYANFRADIAHRLAGERLHLGFYLFWLGWIAQSVYLMLLRPPSTSVDRRETRGS